MDEIPQVSPYPSNYGGGASYYNAPTNPLLSMMGQQGPTVSQNQLADEQPGAGTNPQAQGSPQYMQPNWTGGTVGTAGKPIGQSGCSC